MAKFCLFHSVQTVLVMVFLIYSFNSLISSGMVKCKDLILNKPTADDVKLVSSSSSKNSGVNLIRLGQKATIIIPIYCTLITARYLVRDSN